MVNRAALLLRYKEPFVQWLNESCPDANEPDISMEEANQDKIVYLLDEEEVDNLEEWISLNHQALFESELDGWNTDESRWPKKRDLELFAKWFEVECHTVLIDAGTGPIFDDGE